MPLNASSGTVKYLRNADSHFLSAHEVITAAHLQNLYPNPCKLSPSGYFGSKMVTVIVTGDKNNQVRIVFLFLWSKAVKAKKLKSSEPG